MDEDLLFSKSLQTKALKTISSFISAFPGFIVFGKTSATVYKKGSYFKFSVFEVYKLYLSFFQILNFFTNDDIDDCDRKGLILHRENLNNEEVYFWQGLEVTHSKNNNKKYIKFGIEKSTDTEVRSEIYMTLEDLPNFIKALKSSILICLCLNDIESELIIYASNQSPDEILNLRKKSDAKEFVLKFLIEQKYQKDNISTVTLIQVVQYYCDILILLNKLNSLSTFEEDIGKKILNLNNV
jgi:hypothetical protein